jgi:crotonobetainyl-CoA:carnitine CoA-transferase CaiB-like acyl-CoA transferase
MSGWLTVGSSVALALASGGGVATLVTIPMTRRRLAAQSGRDAAEAVERLSAATVTTVERLEAQAERMDVMRQQIGAMRRQLDEADLKTRALIAELDAATARAALAEAETQRLRDELATKRRRREQRTVGDNGPGVKEVP